MNNLKNSVQLMGHLGRKPELKTIASGKTLANFSIATSEYHYDDKGEKVTETQWHNVTAWGKLAEIADKYLDKGSEVLLQGKLVYNTYEDKNGQKRTSAEIWANELQIINGNKGK